LRPASKRLAAGAAALFILSDAPAATGETLISPDRNVMVIPAGAPVRFASFGRGDVAKFTGRFELKGTYRYGYVRNTAKRARHEALALSFVPDLPLAEELPYWQGFSPPATLSFSNARAFVSRAIPPESLAKLKQKKALSIGGRAAIQVDDYKAGFECGDAHYSVRFVSIARPRPARLSQNFVRAYGC
jgi:hypothetical protein